MNDDDFYAYRQYTLSPDGKYRKNMHITLRLTKDEYLKYSGLAKKNHNSDLREYLTKHIVDLLYGLTSEECASVGGKLKAGVCKKE